MGLITCIDFLIGWPSEQFKNTIKINRIKKNKRDSEQTITARVTCSFINHDQIHRISAKNALLADKVFRCLTKTICCSFKTGVGTYKGKIHSKSYRMEVFRNLAESPDALYEAKSRFHWEVVRTTAQVISNASGYSSPYGNLVTHPDWPIEKALHEIDYNQQFGLNSPISWGSFFWLVL